MNACTLQLAKLSKHGVRIFSKFDFFKGLWCSQKKTKCKNESVFEFHINIVLTIILSTFFFRLKLKKCVRPGIKITALKYKSIFFIQFSTTFTMLTLTSSMLTFQGATAPFLKAEIEIFQICISLDGF